MSAPAPDSGAHEEAPRAAGLRIASGFDSTGLRARVDAYDTDKDGFLSDQEVRALVDDVIVRQGRLRSLKMLAAALGVLGVLFLCAVFALSYVVLNSTKQLIDRGALLADANGAPVRAAAAQMTATLAAPPPDLDAYLAKRYPWATKQFGNGTLLIGGNSLYKHTFRSEGLTAGDVAAACRFSRGEGQPAQQWRLTSALFGAGGFGFNAAFNRIVNCAAVEDADPAGPIPAVQFYGTGEGGAGFFQGCAGDTCDAFLKLDIPLTDFVAGATPSGRRRRLLAAAEVPAALAASGLRACGVFGGPKFAAAVC